MDFANRPKSRAPSGFFRTERGELSWEDGNVNVGIRERYRGAGRLISHFPLAYSRIVQSMLASSAIAFRIV